MVAFGKSTPAKTPSPASKDSPASEKASSSASPLISPASKPSFEGSTWPTNDEVMDCDGNLIHYYDDDGFPALMYLESRGSERRGLAVGALGEGGS